MKGEFPEKKAAEGDAPGGCAEESSGTKSKY